MVPRFSNHPTGWVYCGYGVLHLQGSESAAHATQTAAEASRDEAQATVALVDETKRDRELAWQPVISAELVGPSIHSAQAVNVRNVGAPAIGLRVFLWLDHNNTEWSRSIAFDLAPSEVRVLQVNDAWFDRMPSHALPAYDWFRYDEGPKNYGIAVLFWRDLLGWRYRLPVIAFPVFESLGVIKEGSFDIRVADPERRQPGPLGDWSCDRRIFPDTGMRIVREK